MKILITTDVYTPTVNGVVTSIINLKKELTLRGHEVRVLTLSNREESYRKDDAYYIRSLDMGRVYPGARAAVFPDHAYIRELTEWKPDIVHSQSEFTSYYYARRIAKKAKAPLIHTYHTIYADYTHYFSPNKAIGQRAAAFLTRKLLKTADAVIAPTEKVEALLREYGVKKEIFVLPTGIDLQPFQEAAEEKAAFGQRITDKPVLITVGRVAREKGLEEILELLSTRRGKRYHWLVVGDGPDRPHLEEKVKSLGMTGRVTFTGMIPLKEVANYYQLGDVFVSASKSETQGLTYVEALASGLPVVARKDACLKSVVLDGYNGWQYENAEEFFHALEELLPERDGETVGGRHRVRGWQYEMCSVNAANSAWKFATDSFGAGAERIYRKVRKSYETERGICCEDTPIWNVRLLNRIRIQRQ